MARRRVVVLGGGLAALSAGIHLLDQGGSARFEVKLVCMEHRLGGKAASWRLPTPAGAPSRYMEVGFHAVFGYYDRLRKMLRAVNRRVSDPRWFRPNGGVHRMYEAGSVRAVNRLDLPSGVLDVGALANSGLLSYRGMNAFEKGAAGLWLARMGSRLLGGPVDAAIDEVPFTEYCIEQGLLPELTKKSWFRYILDLAFNYPHAGSAYVGMAGFKKLAGPANSTVYYFNGATSEVMIAPLVERFLALGGSIEFCTKATRVELDPATSSLERIETRPMATAVPIAGVTDRVDVVPIGGTYPLDENPYPPPGDPQPPAASPTRTLRRGTDFDDVVWTLPVESTKALLATTSDPAAHVHAFDQLANIFSLHTIAPISGRIWTPEKLVPPTFDTVVMGTPQPAATIMDYANRVDELRRGPFGSVIEFEGQEGVHGGLTDRQIMTGLLDDFVKLPFVNASRVRAADILNQTNGHHHDFRRNTAHHMRYLLMTPGHWKYRPDQDRCPYDNLVFAGDWVKTTQETASMEAAVRSGHVAANLLRRRAGVATAD